MSNIKTRAIPNVDKAYLNFLVNGVTKALSNCEIANTTISRLKLLEILETNGLSVQERINFTEWAAYVFENEDIIDLSLAMIKSNSFMHISPLGMKRG